MLVEIALTTSWILHGRWYFLKYTELKKQMVELVEKNALASLLRRYVEYYVAPQLDLSASVHIFHTQPVDVQGP